MAQMDWVLLDGYGGRHRVGLYHGDRSGHVVIHCNMRVIQIDFSVKESKMYSFFIEDELCELVLEKKDGRFSYEFRVNKKVDTPRNRIRRAQEGKVRRQMAVLTTGLVLVLAIAFMGLRWYGRAQEAKRIAKTSVFSQYSRENAKKLALDGKQTMARLHLMLNTEGSERRISYALLGLDSLMEQGSFKVAQTGPIILPNGFPFAEGDAFEAIYLPYQPNVHRVEFFLPSAQTIARYLDLAIEAEKHAHPEQLPEWSACRVKMAAERIGWASLAHFVFQEKTRQESARFNQESYQRLVSDPQFRETVRNCCPTR